MYEYLRGRLFAPKSLAVVIDSSECQLYRWLGEGQITAVRLGPRCTRIVGDSVADFLERRQSAPGQPRGKAACRPKKPADVADNQQAPGKLKPRSGEDLHSGANLDADQSGAAGEVGGQ